eukprot:CAMPEP_0172178238 /NCGR_PEP_ID=MMETSP1050-20130122/15909_1 /TAXON_ID=233186 /ORGANISM="Cryptomonas curvata, Strain CCAP979/52" /LENGTH=62 /DNA_ID=CAMNT_0012850903 /DNA_START=48 /DNA_END=232 /DNA_ORIENTATION=+
MADVDAKALVTVLGGQITREAAVALLSRAHGDINVAISIYFDDAAGESQARRGGGGGGGGGG